MFKVGDRIVYPQHGAGVIDGIEKRTVLGEEVEYLTIRILSDDLVVRIPKDLMHLIVEKGSVTVDGISLTAFDLTHDTFHVAVIPHTMEGTTLGVRKSGDRVNIEMDMLAKHVERLVEPHTKRRFWRRKP